MLLLIIATAAVLFTTFLFTHVIRAGLKGDDSALFKGLSHAKGMEQAVIARELSRGNGFSTKVIKPAAIQLFNTKMKDDQYFNKIVDGKTPSGGHIPDTYHAPLNPFMNSLALRAMIGMNNAFKWRVDNDGAPDFWTMPAGKLTHIADKTIAGLSILFFFGAIVLNYFTIKWLFDERLSVIMAVVLLLCQHFWDFATTGLPQLLLLFLFSGVTMCLTKALMAREEGEYSWPWIAGAGVFFGLMALAHPITLWMLLGVVVYLCATYRPVGLSAGILVGVCAIFFIPWMVRTAKVCGDPVGLAFATKGFQLRGTESQIMRTLSKPDENIQPSSYITKIPGQIVGQFDTLYMRLGKVPMALFFFLSLLHTFRKRETRSLRWALICMWLSAVGGMAIFGYMDYDLIARHDANDIHLIFIPLFGAYGLALLLNMWSRVEIEGRPVSGIKFANTAMTTMIIFFSSFPLLSRYIAPAESQVVYPPYYPPYLANLADWYTEKDVICSDMPWGVAWYADRKSLWLPLALRDFQELNSFTFNERITGLLFTPVTGFRGLLSDVGAGEFAEWAPFIMRDAKLKTSFPLSVIKALPIGRSFPYFLYSDRDRWTERQ